MKRQYLNNVTCVMQTPRGSEECTRSLIRPYVLTPRGAERILRAMHRADDREGISDSTIVTSVSAPQFAN